MSNKNFRDGGFLGTGETGSKSIFRPYGKSDVVCVVGSSISTACSAPACKSPMCSSVSLFVGHWYLSFVDLSWPRSARHHHCTAPYRSGTCPTGGVRVVAVVDRVRAPVPTVRDYEVQSSCWQCEAHCGRHTAITTTLSPLLPHHQIAGTLS